MSAGEGTARIREQRVELERVLERTFGPDWRKLAIVGPVTVTPLASLPDEIGPPPPAGPGPRGLFQVLSPRCVDAPRPSVAENTRMAAAYLRERYG